MVLLVWFVCTATPVFTRVGESTASCVYKGQVIVCSIPEGTHHSRGCVEMDTSRSAAFALLCGPSFKRMSKHFVHGSMP